MDCDLTAIASVNFLPLCQAEADIKQTNDSFWRIKKKLECLEQDVPIICPPVNVQFSCHVCLQVSDTSYLIAMSDEFFKGRVSPNFVILS